MVRKLTSIVAALTVALALIPAPKAHAINREIHYTIWFVGVYGPRSEDPVGEWTKYCDQSMGGWGVLPYECYGANPPNQCETDVVYGDICEE